MTRQDVVDLVRKLPDDTPFDKVADEIYKIGFMADVQAGLDDIERGELVSHEEIEKEMSAWLQE